jgi:hypothetical protein
MQKTITAYKIQALSSINNGVTAQILFRNSTQFFVGRIDFYTGVTLPKSYLWHPSNPTDPNQTYLVLAMPFSAFDAVVELLRTEGPWALELWPATNPPIGASTDGYGGKLFTTTDEPIAEEELDLAALRS